MFHVITILIIVLLLVGAGLILFIKVNYFRQQSRKFQQKEYEFVYELAAEGKLKPDQVFKMDDSIESSVEDAVSSDIIETESEPGRNEVRSLIAERIDGLSDEKMRQLLKYLDEEETSKIWSKRLFKNNRLYRGGSILSGYHPKHKCGRRIYRNFRDVFKRPKNFNDIHVPGTCGPL